MKTFDTIGCLLVMYNLDSSTLIVQHYIDLALTLKSFAFPICILMAGASSSRENRNLSGIDGNVHQNHNATVNSRPI
jgi:hypothetical protein